MFSGYLTFAGTELANVARTQAYVDNFLPSFGLTECYGAENLQCVLGEGAYRSPALDEAPWFSPSRPASAKFFGFYPLSVEGIDSSTLSSEITELTGDGAVHSRARASSREIRMTGLLIGEDDEGVDAGFAWLKGLLAGSNCQEGNCDGDTLCYLAYLPKCCDYSEFPEAPVDDPEYVNDVGGWNIYRKGDVVATANGVDISMPCGNDGGQYRLTQLIPGEPYRVAIEIESSDEIDVCIEGDGGLVSKRTSDHFPAPRTPWVIDFVPTTESAALLIRNPGNECDDRTATVYSLLVRRVPRMVTVSMPRFTPENLREPGSWTFSGTPVYFSTNATLNPLGDGTEGIRLRYRNTTGASHNVTPAALVSRTMRGMTPGLTYTAYINYDYSPSGSLVMDVDATVVSSADLGDGWASVTFRASRPQHVISLHLASNVLVAAGNTLSLDVFHLRVDYSLEAWDGDLPIPDQTKPARRTLYDVVTIGGPTVTERFSKKMTGSMVKVEVVLNANHPYIYGMEMEVWKDPSASSFLISQESCINGYPTRTNRFTNPRFTAQTVGTNPQGGISTYTNFVYDAGDVNIDVAGPNAAFSDNSMAMIPLSAVSAETFIEVPWTGEILEGHTYTFSADFALLAPQTAGAVTPNARRLVVVTDDATYKSDQLPNIATSQRLSVTFTYYGGGLTFQVWNGDVASGTTLYVTHFQFEQGFEPTAFFDGASSGASWNGTANQSSSKWVMPSAKSIRDPDCPPLVLPPQPPSIALDCPIDVDEWRRYTQPIPAPLSGGWTFSAPLVRLSTLTSVVRDVRVRFYADPFEEGIESLNPCGYCGEFFVSYIPKNTVLTIDGILREVSANVSGSGTTVATNLVTNSDGGPIEWPLLTCDIPYIMTVDISPGAVLDLSVDLVIARRE